MPHDVPDSMRVKVLEMNGETEMQTKGQIWIFFDSATKKKTKPMTLIEAQMIVLRLKVKQIRKLFIWTPGWEKWQPLEAYLKLNQSFFAVAPSRLSRAVPQENKNSSAEIAENIGISDKQAMVTGLSEGKSDGSEPANEDEVATETVTAAVSGGTYTATATEFVSDSTTTETENGTEAGTETGTETGTQTGTGIETAEGRSGGKKRSSSSTKKKKPVDYEVFDFHGDHLEMKPKAPPMKPTSLSEKRGFGRYEFAFEVILVSKGGKSFRTTSQNISMGGTLLENPIPREFLGTVFDLIIVNKLEPDPKKSRFLFRGKIAGDYNDPRRLTFVDPAKETTENLAALLLSLEAYDEKLKKSPAKPKAG